jgi:uncharacterized protein YggE
MTQQFIRSVLVVTAVFFVQPAWAQFGAGIGYGNGTVTGSGVVEIKRQPDRLRLQVELLAKGSNLKEALALLKDRIEAARLQVGALGVIKKSVAFGNPKLSSTKTDQQKQMEQMLIQRLRQRGKRKPKKSKASSPVTVSAELTAEWKLTAKTIEELLIVSYELQEKIKAADLAGRKQAEKLSPEEQELLEEAASGFGYGSSDEAKPGEPSFLFVSGISDDEREKSLAAAFQKAKSRAARLAKAAGSQLGELKSLSAQNTPGAGLDDYSMYGGYSSPAYRAIQRAMTAAQLGTEDASEAIGAIPGTVTYTITVTASFDLKTD